MCECACGDFGSNLILKIDDNRYINIYFYRGCSYCNQPAGILVQPYDAHGAQTWLLGVPWHKIVKLTFDEYGKDEKFIELFNHNDVVDAARELFEEEGVTCEEYDDPAYMIKDIDRLIPYATWYAYQRQQAENPKD